MSRADTWQHFLENVILFLVEATVGLLCQGPDSGRSVHFKDHRGDLIGGRFFLQECVLKYTIKLRVPLSALRRWEDFSQGTAPAAQNYLDWALLCGLEPNPDSPKKRNQLVLPKTTSSPVRTLIYNKWSFGSCHLVSGCLATQEVQRSPET